MYQVCNAMHAKLKKMSLSIFHSLISITASYERKKPISADSFHVGKIFVTAKMLTLDEEIKTNGENGMSLHVS